MIAEVEGVLTFNNETRDKMLKRNIGKYSQWNFALNPAIGEYYDIDYNRSLKDLKDGKSLLSYTHDGKSEYSEEIQRKFFSFGEGEEYYVRPLTYGELNPWISFQKGNYIQYIDEVFGKDDVMRHVDYVNNLLSGQFIENALRQTEVGVVKDINVAAAMQGIITTNPNNMSGEDTTLGKISNRMYAQTLYNGAKFNSDRINAKIRDGENFYNKSYITPYLVNQYGNNLANVFELSDKMKIGVNETAIREDLGADVHILDGYTEGRFADLSSDEFRFLREQTENVSTMLDLSRETLTSKNPFWPMHRYSMVDGKGYVNWSKSPTSFRYKETGRGFIYKDINGNETVYDDVDWFKPGIDKKESGRKSGPYTYSMYNEDADTLTSLYYNSDYRDSLTKEELEKLGKRVFDINNNTNQNSNNEKNQFNAYTGIADNENTLLSKTTRLFNNQQLDTLIARFHTDKDIYKEPEFTDTAKSAFGNSHGRNLLVRDAATKKPETNGYSNPYCRTWTYHHQYNQVKKLIRPFIYEEGGKETAYTNREIQAMNKKYRAYRNDGSGNAIFGYESLADNTVLQSNGFVRITPKGDDKTNDIKKCMFSIENLAWKDVLKHEDNISKEQTGPNGGRIMWFPPYNLNFQEGVNVSWQPNTFIGRGENVYTYTNTERTGTLSFSLLIDHPSIINSVTKNSYEGMPDEKDVEADILRFFAGCELLEEPDKIADSDNENEEYNKQNKIVTEKQIKFRIYYPNNFSGIVSNRNVSNILPDNFRNYVVSTEVDPNIENNNGYDSEMARDYWWQYILVGNNVCIPGDKTYFRGYEMRDNNEGLYDDKSDFKDITLPTCVGNLYTVADMRLFNDGATNTCRAETVNDTSKLRYYYQVDMDLRQQLHDIESYKDNNSFQLNSSFSWKEKNNKPVDDGEYTFAEVIMALLKYNKEGDVKNVKYGKLYDLYFSYITGVDVGVSEKRINELYNLFNNDKVKFTSITSTASADNNDKSNASMLAKRRCRNGYDTLKRLLQKLENVDIIKTPTTTGGRKNVPAYDEEQKTSRFCEFIIKYTIPSEELSDTASDKGVSQENEIVNKTFEYYLELLRSNSDFIQVASDYDLTFDDRLKERYTEIPNKDEYITNLENDYAKLKQEVTDIINDIDINALETSCFIANTLINCNADYQTKVNGVSSSSTDTLTKSIRERIKRLWDNNGDYFVTGTGNSMKFVKPNLADMYMYFFGIKPNNNVYSLIKIHTNDPFVNMTNFPLREMIFNQNRTQYNVGADKAKYTVNNFSGLSLVIDNLICKILLKYTEYTEHLYEFADELNKTGVYKDIRDLITTFMEYECTPAALSDNTVRDIYFNIHSKIQNITIPSLQERLRREEELKRSSEEENNSQKIERKIEDRKDKTNENKNKTNVVYIKDNIPNTRYETEAEYFNKIDVEDPLLYKNLKDKFKYFNPAYHSISPEGFNARLTFLHQCTRQGQTQEIKSGNNAQGYTGTASNLAFGRMPVCVIRIGDFINARCIIKDMTISYASDSGMLWDLNPEGAGVQPMYANISLGITLLGGQSLGAPISRLQNAISFNYYANAEAYDNRADVAIYEADNEGNTSGNVIYKRLWSPLSRNIDGKLFNNDTKDFEKQHENDGNLNSKTTKPLTDGQIDEKFNGGKEEQESGSTEDTKIEPLVESQDLTDYVLSDSTIIYELDKYFLPGAELYLKMFLNKSYVETGYVDTKNIKWDYDIQDAEIKEFYQDYTDSVYEVMKTKLSICVRNFVNEHNGN